MSDWVRLIGEYGPRVKSERVIDDETPCARRLRRYRERLERLAQRREREKPLPVLRRCVDCGEPFKIKPRGHLILCRLCAVAARREVKRAAALARLKCAVCRKPLKAQRLSARYCSQACGKKARKGRLGGRARHLGV
jgi:hypothetical protein